MSHAGFLPLHFSTVALSNLHVWKFCMFEWDIKSHFQVQTLQKKNKGLLVWGVMNRVRQLLVSNAVQCALTSVFCWQLMVAFLCAVFQERSPTSAHGKAATGGSRARMNWRATTGSTRGPSPSSAPSATGASPALITWRSTWRGIRTRSWTARWGCFVSMQFPIDSRHTTEISWIFEYIHLKEILKGTGNVYFVYLCRKREDTVSQLPECSVVCLLSWCIWL